jgi:hypothetical protein
VSERDNIRLQILPFAPKPLPERGSLVCPEDFAGHLLKTMLPGSTSLSW